MATRKNFGVTDDIHAIVVRVQKLCNLRHYKPLVEYQLKKLKDKAVLEDVKAHFKK